MFAFGNKDRQKHVHDLLNRISNISTPNLIPYSGECRQNQRVNRSIPVLLAAWEDGRPAAGITMNAVTKDIGEQGISFITNTQFRLEEVVVGMYVATDAREPERGNCEFLRGRVKQNFAIGGGFWQIGIEVEEILSESHTPELEQLRTSVELLAPCGV